MKPAPPVTSSMRRIIASHGAAATVVSAGMRVAVTGASGFIGSSLVPELETRSHQVLAVPRESWAIPETFRGSDAVVHLANITHVSADENLLQRVNVDSTRRVAEAAASAGVRRLIYLSSIKASGDETFGRPFDGSETPAPQDAYGRAKCAAERALVEIAARTGMEAILVRPPLVYGPRVKAKFLMLMRAVARGWPLPLGAIRNRRSLVHVGNLADMIVCCVEARKLGGRTFVVSDRAPVSTPELCRAIGEALRRPARLFAVPAGVLELVPGTRALTRSLEVDDSAMRRELGWQPRISFEDGLRRTADWYQLKCPA